MFIPDYRVYEVHMSNRMKINDFWTRFLFVLKRIVRFQVWKKISSWGQLYIFFNLELDILSKSQVWNWSWWMTMFFHKMKVGKCRRHILMPNLEIQSLQVFASSNPRVQLAIKHITSSCVSKICIKYRKNGRSFFSSIMNCTCLAYIETKKHTLKQ